AHLPRVSVPTRRSSDLVNRDSVGIVHAGVDLEAVALARGIFPGMRAQIAQRQLALAAVEFGHLAKFGRVALAGAAREIVEDAPRSEEHTSELQSHLNLV